MHAWFLPLRSMAALSSPSQSVTPSSTQLLHPELQKTCWTLHLPSESVGQKFLPRPAPKHIWVCSLSSHSSPSPPQLHKWPPLPLGGGSSNLLLHGIQDKCDAGIKPAMAPTVPLMPGLALAFPQALLLSPCPRPSSAHATCGRLPSCPLGSLMRTQSPVTGPGTETVQINICFDCWIYYEALDPKVTKTSERKSLLNRSSQSSEWHKCVHREYLPFGDRCDQGKSQLWGHKRLRKVFSAGGGGHLKWADEPLQNSKTAYKNNNCRQSDNGKIC